MALIIHRIKTLFLLLVLSGLCFGANARVTLPAFVSDGMVLQRNAKIPIWGWAEPGEYVTVSFNGKIYSAITADNGKWKVAMEPQKAGGPYTMTIDGDNKITIEDVLVGDVWICSGQSNMAWPLRRFRERYKQDITSSSNRKIRQFRVGRDVSFEPLDKDKVQSEGWEAASPESVFDYSAVGYFFAEAIYDQYNVPVGLINTSWGGTPAQAWVSVDGLMKFPHYIARFNELEKKYSGKTKKKFRKALNARGIYLKQEPATLYNAMIAPLIPYAIKGVIWYQGEFNARWPYEYNTLFPALIYDWRDAWGQGYFPFLYVQLPNFRLPNASQQNPWAVIREAQLKALSVKKTGMAVTIDIGEADRLHPPNKKDVGLRLALAARKIAYGEKKMVYSGPIYHSMKKKGNKMYLKFTHVGSGLMAKGDTGLKHFAIAGADKKFVRANAKIEGDRVVVWNEGIASPVAVRYAWANNPEGCNLYNKEGLPASPFRTDNWKL